MGQELDDFRAEVRAFFDSHAPPALRGKAGTPGADVWGGKREPFALEGSREWLDMNAERGWTAPTWPTEYGGGGLTPAHAKILQAEMRRLRLPLPLTGFGLAMIGPVLLQFGSEEQRAEHLPKITRGQIRWCQGYSEPNAGSDLASLQTAAVADGDHFVLNGQKIWTSYGDLSDSMFLLVRTSSDGKKQAGISFILAEMATPGIEVKPIKLISGNSPFCETFFEDARVPMANVINGLGNGWTVAKALLGHEREMIASVFGGTGPSRGGGIVEVARENLGPDEGPLADPVLRDRLVALQMDQRAFWLTMQRSKDAAKAGHKPGAETSLFKIYGTELNQKREELVGALRGPQCLGWDGEGFDEAELAQTRTWLRSRGNTIEGGTSEVQLNIIAKRVLGLPD